MRKIPTLFVRDPDDMRHVLPEVTPGCGWVLAGEGRATRKYDGTCVMFDGDRWWARREVKPGKAEPANWVEADSDDVTGKRVGWEPIEQTGWVKPHAEAWERSVSWPTGTYELCGPKVNGNPEGYESHVLILHAEAERFPEMDRPAGIEHLRIILSSTPWEGIVWHHPDGRMAKLKRRDFT